MGYLSSSHLMCPDILYTCPRLKNFVDSHLNWTRSFLTSNTIIRGSSPLSHRASHWLKGSHSYRDYHTPASWFSAPASLMNARTSHRLRGPVWSCCCFTHKVQLRFSSRFCSDVRSHRMLQPLHQGLLLASFIRRQRDPLSIGA